MIINFDFYFLSLGNLICVLIKKLFSYKDKGQIRLEFRYYYIWRPLNPSELTQMIFNYLTHLGSEASIYFSSK